MERVTLIAAIIAAAASIIGIAMSYKIQKSTVYIEAITTERVRWLNNLKSLISELLAITDFDSFDNEKWTDEEKGDIRIRQLQNDITFQLNPSDDKEFIDDLQKFVQRYFKVKGGMGSGALLEKMLADTKELREMRENLKEDAQILFKVEWERIKSEAAKKKFDSDECKKEWNDKLKKDSKPAN